MISGRLKAPKRSFALHDMDMVPERFGHTAYVANVEWMVKRATRLALIQSISMLLQHTYAPASVAQ